MIWKTRNGRWLDRFGQWHAWFAWRPVTLENPTGAVRVTRAWLVEVARIGVVVRGRRFWLYAMPANVGLGQPPNGFEILSMIEPAIRQAELRRRARRGEHLRAVK